MHLEFLSIPVKTDEINVRFEDKYLRIKSAVRLRVCQIFSELRDTIIDKLRLANEEIGLG